MTFTIAQKKEAYSKLPQEIQDFIMSNETTEIIESYLKEFGLSEEQSVLADSEILCAMLELQTLAEALSNIGKLNNNTGEIATLKYNLENNIFNKIKNVFKLDKKTEDKVIEISKKYSLDDVKTDILINIVTTNINKTANATFLEEIIKKLEISKLLATQIMEDLDKRVFEYAVNEVGEEKEEEKPQQTESAPKSIPVVENDIPEVRPEIVPILSVPKYGINNVPENLPTENKGVETESASRIFFRPAKPVEQAPAQAPQPQVSPAPTVETPVQQPTAPVTQSAPVSAPPTQSAQPVQSETQKPPEEKKYPDKYVVDPYREPLE